MVAETEKNFFDLQQAEYEKFATEEYLMMSDGAQLRVLSSKVDKETDKTYTIVLFAGWGSVVLGWDEVLMELSKDFNVLYIESREKGSSIISKKSETGMNRISDDLKEIINLKKLDQRKTILFGSCFGATVIAHGLANNKYNPLFSVLIAPPARFDLPPLTRYIVPIVPFWSFNILKPLLKIWIKKSKSESPEQATKYIRVLDEAQGRKWKKFGKPLALPKWWDTYANVESEVLLIAAEADKMHNAKITKEIAKLMKNSTYKNLGDNKSTHSLPVVQALREYIQERQK
ncbi:MAG: alpha/beta fold hydrolase [Candidatus Heimdallarchaeaceae archaeon]